MRRVDGRGLRLLWAAVVVTAAVACGSGGAPAIGEADPLRSRLLGGLPAAEAARGVYVIDLEEGGELSPGSRLAPLVAPLVDDAELLVETAAPPVALLGGVDEGVEAPSEAVRVGDVLVLGQPETRDAVAARLRDGAQPDAALAELAATAAPVAWRGPTPAPDGTGTTTVTLTPDEVRFVVEAPAGVSTAAADGVRTALAEGAPAGSPGKPWRNILGDATVTTEGDRLVVTAVPADLPGLFLRVLLDQRQVTFLPTT